MASDSTLTRRLPSSPALLLGAQAALFLTLNAESLRRMRRSKKRFSLHARRLYNFDTVGFPAMLALSALALPRRLAKAALAVAAAGVAARVYTTHVEPRMLQVRRVQLRSPKL